MQQSLFTEYNRRPQLTMRKYVGGSEWPHFVAAIGGNHIELRTDRKVKTAEAKVKVGRMFVADTKLPEPIAIGRPSPLSRVFRVEVNRLRHPRSV